MSRAEFITHGGHRILRLDCAGLTTDDFIAEHQKAMRMIVAEPERSVRMLTIPTSRFDERMADAIRLWAPKKAKHVLAEAIVGATTVHKLLFLGNKAKYRLEREVFDDEVAAKQWLASR
jgi:hypothetical protein